MSKLFKFGKSKINGQGVFALENINKNQLVCKFTGEKVSLKELERRIKLKIQIPGDSFQVGKTDYIIIKSPFVNINHSCDPNCFIRNRGDLVTLRKIRKGEEITYDYSTTMYEDKEHIKKKYNRIIWFMRKCNCGSKKCRGVIDQFYLLPKKLQNKHIKNNHVPAFVKHTINKK